jgi:hypothetical protein
MIRPNSRLGFSIDSEKSSALRPALERAADLGAERPEQRCRASTAVAMAMPLVMALVVLPTASRLVRTSAPSSLTSPDISAMPWALSEIGPKVSIATMTPTVVSRPVPASATANSATTVEPPPSRNAA